MESADSDTEKERQPSGKPDNTDPDPASHLPSESEEEEEDDEDQPCIFRPFTEQSIRNIAKRIEREQRRAKKKEQDAAGTGGTGTGGGGGGDKQNASEEEKEIPNPLYEVGKTLPPRVGDFPPSLYGTPIEDLDRYYRNKYTFMIVSRDKTIFRFSATKGFFLLGPLNPIRRVAMYILTHPFFSLTVMIVILVNCVFMALSEEFPIAEKTFTGIYTVEGSVKMLARGFIVADFTYLRDAWNWLDFCVVVLAYVTMGIELGNVAVLRTFRVLRALKTVAVVPGLKTIVGALMEAVKRLRDVMILSLFVLSIFALVGLQLYQGSLLRKCIRDFNMTAPFENDTEEAKEIYLTLLYKHGNNSENWEWDDKSKPPKLCGTEEEGNGGKCPANFTCKKVGNNPDFSFTNFDSFPWALLCAFRLMTQDFWENLYQQVIRANGPNQMLFFIIVIFFGSFYLVNVILAIVAMAYDDCKSQDDKDADAEEAAEAEARLAEQGLDEDGFFETKKSPSVGSANSFIQCRCQNGSRYELDRDRISMKSDCAVGQQSTRRRPSGLQSQTDNKLSVSLPGSPYGPHRLTRHRSSQFSWRRPPSRTSDGSWRPMVMPCLDNLDLPYADDSTAVTPTSEDLCNFHNAHYFPLNNTNRRRLSSCGSRLSQLENRFGSNNRHQQPPVENFFPSQSNQLIPRDWETTFNCRPPSKPIEPTHFHWNVTGRNGKKNHLVPSAENAVQPIHCRRESSNSVYNNWDRCKGKMMILDNPFICRTPSATTIDLQDVLVLKDLIKNAAGKKKGLFGYEKGMNKKEFLKEKCLQLLFGWECHPIWYKIAHFIELFIMDAFIDLFITLCIVVNTVFMAMEHAHMSATLVKVLSIGNYVFTAIFTVEAGLKVLALGLYKYLEDKWSCFDFIIVILSMVEMGLENVKGLSILRSFRLLRVFKLAKSWPTLNLLIGIIGRTMGALGNLCFVLAIIIFIFAVMGMQLFGSNYKEDKFPFLEGEDREIRWHFKDFFHSFMIVFRILCGEWIENMWVCIRACGYQCIPFFLLTMIIGNLVVLNLFLALLLSSFGAESLKHSQEDEGPNKLQEAVDRINRFIIYIKSHITYCIKVKIRHKPLPVEYYYEEGGQNFIGTIDAIGGAHGDGEVVTTVTPMGNGRIREAESIPEEEDDSSPQHYNSLPAFTLRLVKGTTKSPHVGYSPVFPYEPDEYGLDKADQVHNCAVSVMSEPSTVKVSKASSHNSRLSRPSSPRSQSSLTKGSLGSPRSLMSSTETDFTYSHDEMTSAGGEERRLDGPEINEVNVVFVKYPDECCPRLCMDKCSCWSLMENTAIGQVYWKFRCLMFALVENNYFETFIIIMILTSSLALAIEDKHIDTRPNMQKFLKVMDRIYTIIFVFEMVVKMAAYGFKKYFTDAWCWLDFIIVAISLVGWFAEGAGVGNMGAFRALRTLRALRPLRAVSRWEGMKVVVNALIQAIPAIFNVLLVCLVFWLIFSIMGVNLFMGRFGRCLNSDGEMVKIVEIGPGKFVINGTNDTINQESCENNYSLTRNFTWKNPKVNFDNVLIGYLSLFQVATFKGWMDIMYASIDSREEKEQPLFEIRVGVYLYYVLFIVFGAFFTLNLFIGVIIENFNMQKKKAGGSMEMLMTEDQKKYYNAMKKLGSKQPTKPIPKPKLLCQLFFFNLTKNQKFDVGIMAVILLNMTTMAIEHYSQPEWLDMSLKYINTVFIVIFTMECIMKLLALRFYYFKEPWNVFDFIVVVTSLLTMALQEYLTKLPISPTMLRVIRVFRVGRVLRLVKSAKGIRTLLFSLAVSMPALFNIGLLLFLVMFIYAIVGMSSFMHVKHTGGIDDMFNFETFFNSMIILFQTCTSAGWDGVLAGLMNDTPPDCDNSTTPSSPSGDCGNSALGMMFLVSYLVITFLVIINMYIAVILENFSQATEDVQQGLTQDDFDMYYELWERFDEKATQYIDLSQLCDFVDTLEPPLQLPAPNLYKLVSMNIPICENDRVHCVDILDALTKNFLGTATEATGELGDLKGPEKLNYHPISTTLKRQRELVVARLIQKTWREYVRRKRLKHAEEELEFLDHEIVSVDVGSETSNPDDIDETKDSSVHSNCSSSVTPQTDKPTVITIDEFSDETPTS